MALGTGASAEVVAHFRSLIDTPLYLVKRLRPFLGCDLPDDADTGTVWDTDVPALAIDDKSDNDTSSVDYGSCGAGVSLKV